MRRKFADNKFWIKMKAVIWWIKQSLYKSQLHVNLLFIKWIDINWCFVDVIKCILHKAKVSIGLQDKIQRLNWV